MTEQGVSADCVAFFRRFQLELNGKEWNLASACVGTSGALHLAEALKSTYQPKLIDLYRNKIGLEGMRHITDALKDSSLQIIGLRGNQIMDEGVHYLAAVLKKNTSLTTIDLGDNNLYFEGAMYLANAIRVNSSITTINLRGNSIGPEGAHCLAEAVKFNFTIETISVRNNNIGDQGACHFAEALLVNSSLIRINLAENNISPVGAKQLIEALSVNYTISTFNFEQNCAHASQVEDIKKLLSPVARHQRTKFAIHTKLAVAVPSNRCVVTLAGSGEAGKSTTLCSLRGQKFVETRTSTRGVDASVVVKQSHLHGFQDATVTSETVCHALSLLQQPALRPGESGLPMSPTGKILQAPARETMGIHASPQSSTIVDVVDASLRSRQSSRMSSRHKRSLYSYQEFKQIKIDVKRDNLSVATQDLEAFLKCCAVQHELARKTKDGWDFSAFPDGVRMSVFDMGGQSEFWSITSMFQRNGGISCVVARADRLLAAIDPKFARRPSTFQKLKHAIRGRVAETSDPLGDNELDATVEFRMWLDSVACATNTGAVFIIVTFGDKVKSDEQRNALQRIIISTLETHALKKRVVLDQSTKLPYFIVNNCAGLKDPGIMQLISQVEDEAAKSTMATIKCAIWVKMLQDAVLALAEGTVSQTQMLDSTKVKAKDILRHNAGEDGKVAAIYLTDLLHLALTINTTLEEHEFAAGVKFLHNQNVITHFTSGALRDFVLLSPAWFLASVTCIVRNPDLHPLPQDSDADCNSFKRLYQHGLLSTDLIELFLSHLSPPQKNMLLLLMTTVGIIVPFGQGPESTEFLVPALLKPSNTRCALESLKRKPYAVAYIAINGHGVDFPDVVKPTAAKFLQPPAGFFSLLQTALIRHSQASQGSEKSTTHTATSEHVLSRDYSFVWLGNHPVEIEMNRSHRLISVKIYMAVVTPILKQIQSIINDLLSKHFNDIEQCWYVPDRPVQSKVNWLDKPVTLVKLSLIESHQEKCATDSFAILELNNDKINKVLFEEQFQPFIFTRDDTNYHIFVSYRHGEFDSAATAQFVNCIDGRPLYDSTLLNTFYDIFSLREGERFDVGFMVGMLKSMIVVPFVSMDALDRMMDPDNISHIDNTLLEWSLALHLKENRRIHRILPIFIGPVTGVGTGTPSMEDLFENIDLSCDLPDEVNEATYTRLAEFCETQGLPIPKAKTVRSIVSEVFCFKSSNCLCWELIEGRGRLQRSLSSVSGTQSEAVSASLRDHVAKLASQGKSFLRMFSVCATSVLQVVEKTIQEIKEKEAASATRHRSQTMSEVRANADSMAAQARIRPHSTANLHLQLPTGQLSTRIGSVTSSVAIPTANTEQAASLADCQKLQDVMATHAAFARYAPQVEANSLTFELIEQMSQDDLIECLGFEKVHACLFHGWLQDKYSATSDA
eukprot:m.136912 g.136912  ORF g.136912 m.136912 type:complete len:1414 (+) comp14001_c0_seq18:107-4348(+)